MQGLMMDMPLLVSGLIKHADRFHGATEIVSKTIEGNIHRYGWRDVHRRAKRVANALKRLGVGMQDRVGTLAWNNYRHLEVYYGVAGGGAGGPPTKPPPFPPHKTHTPHHTRGHRGFFPTT